MDFTTQVDDRISWFRAVISGGFRKVAVQLSQTIEKMNPAVKAGQRTTSSGDTLVIHGSNGAVQERRSY